MYESLIKNEERKQVKLHQAVHDTYRNRSVGPEKWKMACKEFHAYSSPLEPHIQQLFQASALDSGSVEFAIQYLEVNPFYFQSGYIKEHILQKLKRAALSKKQTQRLRGVLYKSALNCPFREYRRYCRLAVFISNQELRSKLDRLRSDKSKSVKSRAELMLRYVTKHGSA